jgi:invasion protein IalB
MMMALAALAAEPATAQTAEPAPAPAPAAAPAASGEAAWKVVCPPAASAASAEGAAPQPCSLMQNLVAGDKQQRLLTVLLNRQADGGHGMTIALPHGVLFLPGVTVQVDDAVATKLAVQTSDQNGAYTGTAVDAAMLTALKAGKTLKIGFTTGSGQQIIVPVTLKDFGPGVAELDSRPSSAKI